MRTRRASRNRREHPAPRRAIPRMMHSSRVVHIFIARNAGAPMVALQEVSAVEGRGLEGDRYFHQAGTRSGHPGCATEVTLAELEILEALRRDDGIVLDSHDLRRNLITEGVTLSTLVGREFRVGETILRGVMLCEPCAHLERATRRGVLRALVHRAGLRARILAGGTIRAGDPISELPSDDHDIPQTGRGEPARAQPERPG